ncbi:MAG: signal transduction histidine kinase [Phenylobacterium sp.]|jgi:signal transduction histidine kinase
MTLLITPFISSYSPGAQANNADAGSVAVAKNTVLQDSRGFIWFATDDGLHFYDGVRVKVFHHIAADPSSLSSDVVSALYEDSAGRLWVGTNGGGLNRFDRQTQSFTRFTHSDANLDSLSDNHVVSIYQDKRALLWVVTKDSQPNRFDEQNQAFKHHKPVKLTYKGSPKRKDSVGNGSGQASWWQTGWFLLVYSVLFVGGLLLCVKLQRKKVLTERAKNLHLQHADERKDVLLANTVHELRTPISGMVGLAEALIDGAGGPLPEQANHQLSMMVSSGQRLSHLLNDILDCAMLKNKTLTMDSQPQDLHAIVEVVLALSRPLLGRGVSSAQSVELVNGVPEGLPSVLADPNRLQQILHNLVDNGIKFSDGGKVVVSAEIKGKQLCISVEDTGRGISTEQLSTLFDDTTRGNVDGAGLGLVVSKQLAELHGGELTVESHLGEGSTFCFTLPMTREKVQNIIQPVARLYIGESDVVPDYSALTTHQTKAKGRTKTQQFSILLVDDQPVGIEVLRNHLAVPNYQLVEASSPEQALKLISESAAKGKPFDLILLDIMMTEQSGFELCQQIRQDHPVNDLPVIFLSAKNQLSDLMQSFAAGGNDYLAKPVNKDELLSRVDAHLRLRLIHRTQSAEVERCSVTLQRNNLEVERKNQEVINTQQQLVQSEKMAALGTLTAGVAHEINNPTNFVHVSAQNLDAGLVSFQQFLFKLAGDDADDEILERFRQQFKPLHAHLATIKNGTDRIKIIVRDLRAFTQLDCADQKTVRITDLLQSTVNLVKTKYLEVAEFVIDFEATPDLYCHPAQLNQVFMNLIINSCDAISEKNQHQEPKTQGKIIVGCKLVDGFVEISINDNGWGMTQETKNKLFEPFYTTKNLGEGTGLGLSISFGIVEKHRGEWVIESELGVGTTFRLRLPT